MNKKIILAVLVAVVLGGAGFYSGMVYAKGQGRGGAGTRTAGTMFQMRGGADGFTSGQIINKDTSSITIKMQDGSTKIVLVGTSTQISKTSVGAMSDLSSGTDVVVTGSTNSDGSITAQNVQTRPAGSPAFFGGRGQGSASQ